MMVAVLLALARPERRPEIPLNVRRLAQAVVGAVLASSFSPDALRTVAVEWPAVAMAVGGTMALSVAVGLVLYQVAPMDKKTARLGVLPGAASGMLAMGDSLGADIWLVALMQYGRVTVVVTATMVASVGDVSNTAAVTDAGSPALSDTDFLVGAG